jgi:glycosyltransferase involved in cell wall biosynthesis
MSDPMFTVVLPVYNREQLVQRAIESVLEQKETDYELIVVDDGSTDKTVETVREYGEALTLIEQTNAGPGAARNRGIQAATGEYVTFLDSDDQWLPWTLSVFREVIQRHDRPAFVCGNHVDLDLNDTLDTVTRTECIDRHWPDYYTVASNRNIWIRPPSVAIRTDVLRDAGGFSSKGINAEDADLWMKLGTADGFVHVQQPPVSTYHRHEEGVVQNLMRTYEGMLHLIEQERTECYPGGRERRKERRIILTRHIRAASASLAKEKYAQEAWDLYRKTLKWNVGQGQLKYALVFPVLGVGSWVQSCFSEENR